MPTRRESTGGDAKQINQNNPRDDVTMKIVRLETNRSPLNRAS